MRLSREIAGLLALKLLALAVLYVAFFGPAHQTQVTPRATAAHLLGG